MYGFFKVNSHSALSDRSTSRRKAFSVGKRLGWAACGESGGNLLIRVPFSELWDVGLGKLTNLATEIGLGKHSREVQDNGFIAGSPIWIKGGATINLRERARTSKTGILAFQFLDIRM